MAHFYQSAFMEALGWSLMDSFWKLGSLWVLYIIITGNSKWHRAITRYALAVALMTIGSIWSFASVVAYYNEIISGQDISSPALYFRVSAGGFAIAEQAVPWLTAAYIFTVILLSARMLYQYVSMKNSVGKNLSEPDERIKNILSVLKWKTGITKNTGIYFSSLVSVPVTTGFLKPLILLPVAVLNQLTIEQTESVIAHELFHIRHNDYLVNILVSVAGAMLFFNPFSSFFRAIIRKERELSCDDEVMAMGGDHWQYAHALYTLGKYDANLSAFAMAATGEPQFLLERVRRILKVAPVRRSLRELTGSIVKPVLLFFLCLTAAIFFKIAPATKSFKTANSGLIVRVSNQQPARQTEQNAVKKTLRREEIAAKIYRKKPVRRTDKFIRGVHQDLTKIQVAPASPVPRPEPVIINSFVSSMPQTPDFTMVVPGDEQVIPKIKLELSTIVPYVPSATFYYSDVEKSRIENGRKTVHL